MTASALTAKFAAVALAAAGIAWFVSQALEALSGITSALAV
jgi:hypothetical protein